MPADKLELPGQEPQHTVVKALAVEIVVRFRRDSGIRVVPAQHGVQLCQPLSQQSRLAKIASEQFLDSPVEERTKHA